MSRCRRYDYDAIRAIAAGVVAFSHWFPDTSVAQGFMWGRFGVVAFFVLSGYFIGDMLNRLEHSGCGAKSILVSFAVNRLLRIVPPYLILICAVAVTGYIYVVANIGPLLTFTVNFSLAGGALFGYAVHLWTISLEVQFYALWGIVFVSTAPERRRYVIAGMFAIGLAYRMLCAEFGADWVVTAYMLPATVDSFAVGLWLAGRPDVARPAWLVLGSSACLLVLLAWISFLPFQATGNPLFVGAQDVLMAWCTAGVMLLMDRAPNVRRSFVVRRILGPLGLISYGFYLYHFFAEPLFLGLGAPLTGVWRAVGFTAVSIAAAAISWVVIERPSLRLRGPVLRRLASA